MTRHEFFPDVLEPDATGLVARGGKLTPETILEAYRRGIFPWSGEDPIPWCAPDPRLVLSPDRFVASRSLKKLARQGRYTITFDRDFGAVIRSCASVPRADQDGTWITQNLIQVYEELHRRGVAHSVEVREGGELVGGLYGLSLGRAFFGDSMFHRHPNTSKLGLYALCRFLAAREFHFVDCQAVTLHLLSLGATPVPLSRYLRLLAAALAYPTNPGPWSIAG